MNALDAIRRKGEPDAANMSSVVQDVCGIPSPFLSHVSPSSTQRGPLFIQLPSSQLYGIEARTRILPIHADCYSEAVPGQCSSWAGVTLELDCLHQHVGTVVQIYPCVACRHVPRVRVILRNLVGGTVEVCVKGHASGIETV